jgi:hypothetical protein
MLICGAQAGRIVPRSLPVMGLPRRDFASRVNQSLFEAKTFRNSASWLDVAQQSGIYAAQRFVRTVRRDLGAVTNALTEEWSNGQTEGQINRLKTLKRAMYGRAGPELLRARMLPLHSPIERKRSLRATGVGELMRCVRLPVDRRRELWARPTA